MISYLCGVDLSRLVVLDLVRPGEDATALNDTDIEADERVLEVALDGVC